MTNELIAALSKPVTTGIVGEWLGGDKLFCSQLVTEAYKAAKVQLPVLPLAAPGDLIRQSQDGLLQTVGRLDVQATKAVPRSGLFSADWELTVKRLLA